MNESAPKPKRRVAYGRLLGWALLALVTVMMILGLVYGVRAYRLYSGDLPPEPPDPLEFPVMGVDVSHYQGAIDWETFAAEGVTFAFIKATEGSTHEDTRFPENWRGARESGIYAGAYHFFCFDSPGEEQAQHFIDIVGDLDGCLPPVVDLELYGDYAEEPPSRGEVREILMPLLTTLEARYGVKPILYVTPVSYTRYILGGDYGEYPLWRRNLYTEPAGAWEFWQYSDEGRLAGYTADSPEQTIDLNVYRGSMETLAETFDLAPRKEGEA